MNTHARLSFWLPPASPAAFETVLTAELLPILKRHGLGDSALCTRKLVEGVSSHVFSVDSPLTIPSIESTLQHDPAWQQKMQALGEQFLAHSTNASLRYSFDLYSTSPVMDIVVEAGAGTRAGSWQRLSVQDGLVSPIAYDFLQDEQGRLWIATADGVSCYDGTRFENFSKEHGLPASSIISMAQDNAGDIWFASNGYLRNTSKGVGRYDGETFHIYTEADGLVDDRVLSMRADAEGRIWVGTRAGISCYDGEEFVSYTESDGQCLSDVHSLYFDAVGAVWFGMGSGRIARYDGESFTHFSSAETGLSEWVRAISEDANGKLWVGARDGICCFDGECFEPFDVSVALGTPGGAPRLLDSADRLWFTSYPQGVFYYDGNEFKSFTAADGLPNNQVMRLFEDRNGQVWVGTDGGGIGRYDGDAFSLYTERDGLLDDGLFFVREDRAQRLWVGTFRGLNCNDEDTWEAVRSVGAWVEAFIDLLEDLEGNFWATTHVGHVYRNTDGTWCEVLHNEQPFMNVGTLAEDPQGNIWCANGGPGINCWDGSEWRVYTTADGLVGDDVKLVMVDRSGAVWITTMQGGISRFDGEKFETITAGAEVGFYCILRIKEDSQGIIWIGTEGGGLVRYDGSEFRRFTTADGLSCDRVMAICEDQEGRLWLGTQGGGVCLYDGQVFQCIDQRSGLSNDVVKDIIQDHQGDMWLATEAGLVRYRPQQREWASPQIEVVADRRYGPDEDISISVSQGSVRFEFQGNGLAAAAGEMVYVYQLEGYDKKWCVSYGGQASYDHLPIGLYQIQVRAVDRDLNYSAIATAPVQITQDLQVQALRNALSGHVEGEFIGDSEALSRVQMQLAQIAESDITVLIQGETGTGKGMAARLVHQLSERSEAPFIQVNCGAIPEMLVESEMFGHEKGAFSGAHARKLGKVELAAGGTLFLDEIGDMPLDAQVKLLRLLEEREFERVGGAVLLKSDARIITATNRNLAKMVKEGTFREDLFFRIQVFRVELPPLRERREDIPSLVEHWMDAMAAHVHKHIEGIDSVALGMLKRYDWPGNVRELKHAVERAVIVCRDGVIREGDVALSDEKSAVKENGEMVSLEEYERRYICQVLKKTGWVVKGEQGAAALLGLNPGTLYSRMKKLGIERPA